MDTFMLKKNKQVEDSGSYIHKRDVSAEASYLAPEFLNMQKNETNNFYNVDDENLNLRLNKYLHNQSESLQYDTLISKERKYNLLNNKKSNAIGKFAGTYGNHGTSKRKKSFKSSAKYYKNAAIKTEKLNNRIQSESIDTNSSEYIDARIDILNERLKGMLDASEAKSYSSNDEKLRKNAARVKIYTSMLRIYGEKPEEYSKKISKLQQELDKSLTEYKRLAKLDKSERQTEEAKRRKKARQVNNINDMDIDQLRQEIKYILDGQKVDFIPDNVHAVRFINGKLDTSGNYLDQYESACTQNKVKQLIKRNLAERIKNDPQNAGEILDKALEDNNDVHFSIIQGVLGAYKKALLLKESELNNIQNLEESIRGYELNAFKQSEINNYLRYPDANNASFMKDDSEKLKKALNNTSLDYDLVVRHGVDINAIGSMMEELKGKDVSSLEMVGQIVKDKLAKNEPIVCKDNGIISTSIFAESGFQNDLDLVILCKKGTKALDISHGNGTGDNIGNKQEVMLAPGTNFIVRGFKELETKGSGPKWRMYLETVTSNDSGQKVQDK